MEIFIHFVAHASMDSASCVTFPEGDSEGLAAGVFDHENPPLSVTEKAFCVIFAALEAGTTPVF